MNDSRPVFQGFRPFRANFTAAPNQFFDHVVGHNKPCVERVVAILIRATLGWEDPDTGERRLEAELSLEDFVRPQLSRYSAREGLAGAIEAGYVVETLPATNRAPARYALRWEDAAAQAAAIERQRQARGPLTRKGVPAQAPRWRRATGTDAGPEPANVRGAKFRRLKTGRPEITPPINIDSVGGKKNWKEKETNPSTLNVGTGFDFVSAEERQAGRPARTGPSASFSSSGNHRLNRQAEALAAELHDLGSERRHRQLLSICEQHGLWDLPDQALRATRRRLDGEEAHGPLEKPGAYYQRVLVALLAERQVFVPTLAEKAEDDPKEVRRIVRASLGQKGE